MADLEQLAQQLLTEATQRRAAIGRLRMMQAMLDAMPLVATVKDASSRYVYVNAAGCRRFGLCEAQWLGQRDDVVFPAAQMVESRAMDARVLITGNPARAILRGVRLTTDIGPPVDWYVTKVRFEDEQGALYVAAMALDMTEMLRDTCDLYAERELMALRSLAAEADKLAIEQRPASGELEGRDAHV